MPILVGSRRPDHESTHPLALITLWKTWLMFFSVIISSPSSQFWNCTKPLAIITHQVVFLCASLKFPGGANEFTFVPMSGFFYLSLKLKTKIKPRRSINYATLSKHAKFNKNLSQTQHGTRNLPILTKKCMPESKRWQVWGPIFNFEIAWHCYKGSFLFVRS